MRTLKTIACLAVVASSLLAIPSASAIENERGKTYRLTEKHGPWMIMVTSFRNIREEDRKTEGLSAEEAAAELVFELREKGIPAYTYSQDGKVEKIETQDRLGAAATARVKRGINWKNRASPTSITCCMVLKASWTTSIGAVR